jgi:hypothetical protein
MEPVNRQARQRALQLYGGGVASEGSVFSLVEPWPLWVYTLAAQQLCFHREDILDLLVLAEHVSDWITQSLQSVALFTRL